MGMGFAPAWLRQLSPLLHKTTLTTGYCKCLVCTAHIDMVLQLCFTCIWANKMMTVMMIMMIYWDRCTHALTRGHQGCRSGF